MLDGLVSASHLNRLRSVSGGVWLIDGGSLGDEGRRALIRYAAAYFDSREDFYVQVRQLLETVSGPTGAPLRSWMWANAC